MSIERELESAVYAGRDSAVSSLSKAVADLAAMIKKSHGHGRARELFHGANDEPAKPDEMLDDTTERAEEEANEEVEESRFEGPGAEPRDEPDERAQREAAQRQKRVARKKSRHEDEDEDEEDEERDKSRHEEEDEERDKSRHVEGCMCEKCKSLRRARKARRGEDAAEDAIGDSQRAYIYDEDWDEDDEDLHGYFDDPTKSRDPGAADDSDREIITNMGRRLRPPSYEKEGHGGRRPKSRSASEAFYSDLAKSSRAAAVIDASDELSYLTDVLGAHLDRQVSLAKSLAQEVGRLRREVEGLRALVEKSAAVTVEVAKSIDRQPEVPMFGVPFVPPSRRASKSEAAVPGPAQIKKSLLAGMQQGIVGAEEISSFEALMETPAFKQAPEQAVREWIDTMLSDEQAAALGFKKEVEA